MKLLKSLSSMALAVVFLLAFSCAQKTSSEGEEAAAEATDTEEVVEEMETKMDSTAMEMMDSTDMDSEAMEAVDSASMEN